KKGEWAASPNGEFSYSIENLRKIILNAEIQTQALEDLILIKGFFEKTAHEVNSNNIAILHLDGDLYRSVRDPLFVLADKIAPGGIVVVDDFALNDPNSSTEAFPGARRAIEEFLCER